MANLPATNPTKEIVQAFIEGSPMQRLLGETLDRLGGLDFVQEWAEDNPDSFMRLLMAANPAAHPASKGTTLNLNLHPSLSPGPLDIVSEQ